MSFNELNISSLDKAGLTDENTEDIKEIKNSIIMLNNFLKENKKIQSITQTEDGAKMPNSAFVSEEYKNLYANTRELIYGLLSTNTNSIDPIINVSKLDIDFNGFEEGEKSKMIMKNFDKKYGQCLTRIEIWKIVINYLNERKKKKKEINNI